jgi:hypothetical protein
MTTNTIADIKVDEVVLYNYFGALIGRFFKILPMRENGEESLPVYIESLRDELLGCSSVMKAIEFDPSLLTLVCILQFMLDTPDAELSVVKRETFRAISICTKLKHRFGKDGD